MANAYERAGLLDYYANADLKTVPQGPTDPDLLPLIRLSALA
jgi:hypothetical protein